MGNRASLLPSCWQESLKIDDEDEEPLDERNVLLRTVLLLGNIQHYRFYKQI